MEKRYLFAKFKMNKSLETMESMMVSENRSTIDEWKGPSGKKRPEHEDSSDLESPFRKVSADFENSINTFQRTVPFIMGAIPMMRSLHDDIRVRRFIAKNGEKLESGDFELYRLGFEHITAIEGRLQDSTAIASGINRIPRLFLMGLIGAYDAFLSQLIRCIFVVRPELVSASERNLSFKELTEIGSVEAARERIIEKEVESVIRDSHTKQIDWLEEKLKLTLKKDLEIWPSFIELCERRNLLSHTDGVVSSQYLTVCKQHGVNIGGLSVGDQLDIDFEYYNKSVSVILEFGTKLTQVTWRKLLPDQIDVAAQQLSRTSFGLITKRKYSEAITLLRFGLYEMKKHGEDFTKKSMIVNLANAEKLNGDKEEAEKVLKSEDWSGSADKFKICVAAVSDDVQTVIKMMKQVVNAGQLEVSDFQDWPVFETTRANPLFVEAFEQEFGQRIVADRQASAIASQIRDEEIDGEGSAELPPGPGTVH